MEEDSLSSLETGSESEKRKIAEQMLKSWVKSVGNQSRQSFVMKV